MLKRNLANYSLGVQVGIEQAKNENVLWKLWNLWGEAVLLGNAVISCSVSGILGRKTGVCLATLTGIVISHHRKCDLQMNTKSPLIS